MQNKIKIIALKSTLTLNSVGKNNFTFNLCNLTMHMSNKWKLLIFYIQF